VDKTGENGSGADLTVIGTSKSKKNII
jgi:hypothetical protein